MAALIFRKGAYYPGSTQSIVTSGTSQVSNAFTDNVSIIRVATNQDVYCELGNNPTATTGSMLMPAGAIEFFAVDPGQKIAVLQVSTSGRFTVTELL